MSQLVSRSLKDWRGLSVFIYHLPNFPFTQFRAVLEGQRPTVSLLVMTYYHVIEDI